MPQLQNVVLKNTVDLSTSRRFTAGTTYHIQNLSNTPVIITSTSYDFLLGSIEFCPCTRVIPQFGDTISIVEEQSALNRVYALPDPAMGDSAKITIWTDN